MVNGHSNFENSEKLLNNDVTLSFNSGNGNPVDHNNTIDHGNQNETTEKSIEEQIIMQRQINTELKSLDVKLN